MSRLPCSQSSVIQHTITTFIVVYFVCVFCILLLCVISCNNDQRMAIHCVHCVYIFNIVVWYCLCLTLCIAMFTFGYHSVCHSVFHLVLLHIIFASLCIYHNAKWTQLNNEYRARYTTSIKRWFCMHCIKCSVRLCYMIMWTSFYIMCVVWHDVSHWR